MSNNPMSGRKEIKGLVLAMSLAVFAAQDASAEQYTALVFLPITPIPGCSFSSSGSGSCSGLLSSDSGEYENGVDGVRSLWEEQTILVDGASFATGGRLTAGHFNDPGLVFEPGHFYIIDTNVVPDHGNAYAPAFSLARDYSVYAHWTLIRAWTERAAQDVDHLAIVGHSFSGPGVVLTASTVQPSVAEKIDAVVSVTSPMAGLSLAAGCAAYAEAACDLQPNSPAMVLLDTLARNAVDSPTRRLGEKYIAVAAEVTTPGVFGGVDYRGHDGFIPTDSQLFLAEDYTALRGRMGTTPAEDGYWAVFFELVDGGFNPLHNYHIDANTGPGMEAAAAFIDERMVGGYTYCTQDVCGEGDGDCDSHAECSAGLRCLSNRGLSYGWANNVDVCEARVVGDWDYCSTEFRCGVGEGHCNNNSECASGLQCLSFGGKLGQGRAYCSLVGL